MKTVNLVTQTPNPGHYSAGVISGNTLYVSGQLPIDLDTREVCQGDISEQTRLALANVERVLKQAGCTRESVVMSRIYTSDVAYWGAINAEYAKFFGEHRPARVIVSTTTLHFGCLVEIEATAEIDPTR